MREFEEVKLDNLKCTNLGDLGSNQESKNVGTSNTKDIPSCKSLQLLQKKAKPLKSIHPSPKRALNTSPMMILHFVFDISATEKIGY